MKTIVTLDEATMTTVIGIKYVGDDCQLSACCFEIAEYNESLMGSNYNAINGSFTDGENNVIYTVGL
jgi:hypothetical protein